MTLNTDIAEMRTTKASAPVVESTTRSSAVVSRQGAPRILMVGGGTGGHAYPAIAIADAIRAQNPRAVVEFAGSRTNIEWRIVPEAGYAIHHVSVRGLQRKLTLANLAMPFVVSRGLVEAHALIRHFDADIIVGTGGYVAMPVILAARVLRRPIVLQEQNAFMGLTNRVGMRFATRLHVAFPEAIPNSDSDRCRLTGNPVRTSLTRPTREEAHAHFNMSGIRQVIFMTGGSLGSQVMNEVMAESVRSFLSRRDTAVIWQTGDRYFDRYKESIPEHPNLHLLRYVSRMDMAYNAADLVVCRAGASTCSELMLTGSAPLLIPSPNVAEDHQTQNARSLEKAGAAEILPESRMRADFRSTVRRLLDQPDRLAEMRTQAKRLARPDAAADIARDVLNLAMEGLN
ncbi:MAG: undecaprenyldiphospho-muramoylpentapeptide beta-N-acetylglucosaminyltransferase [Bacteroidetes bacterium]|nr:undecaprenyldiphospho-muramoylpentapeptide beta-N-acetylglucosaminyltransferase [Bacteroidota bacterium]